MSSYRPGPAEVDLNREAVELVLVGENSAAEADRQLGFYGSPLGNWVKQAHIDHGQHEGSSIPGTGSGEGASVLSC
ncbi:transposase-like protein [Actinopolyspora biskrensis]|uniref:Transposase-like protein n=1 Tax=Actinopolyspora biskrensis TaxID=1470178 RepID=A0A852YVC3_9ACTN|nr:transposase-like protein [Actinopolyspora biskrensis]